MAKLRATTSLAPPGAKALIRRTGLDGYGWAREGPCAAPRTRMESRIPMRFMRLLPLLASVGTESVGGFAVACQPTGTQERRWPRAKLHNTLHSFTVSGTNAWTQCRAPPPGAIFKED